MEKNDLGVLIMLTFRIDGLYASCSWNLELHLFPSSNNFLPSTSLDELSFIYNFLKKHIIDVICFAEVVSKCS